MKRRILEAIMYSLMAGIVTVTVLLVFGPTELFPEAEMSWSQVGALSLRAGMIAFLLVLACFCLGFLAAWASTQGKQRHLFRNRH